MQKTISIHKLLVALVLSCVSSTLSAQTAYWQQQVNFVINVALNDSTHSLDAFERIDYTNNAPDTLKFIWFHLWPNAYKNDRTAFSEQLLTQRRTDFYFSKEAEKGYINQLNFKVDEMPAATIADSNHIDIVKVVLPRPLPPGGKIIITTPFKVKLPFNFSRGGHVGHSYQVTQWFPKPAVYDRSGWHQMPYLDQGEFYSDFGKYDVEITAPSAYAIAATGVLQDAETLRQLKKDSKHIAEGKTKTWHYTQDSVHDFAWFATKDLVAHYDTMALPSGKVIDIASWYRPQSKGWDASLKYMKNGLRNYSRWLGDYPYNSATVVQGAKNVNSGGMEYPTITLITTQNAAKELDITIAHELGHNWFEAALATNERQHPWMDEGMNSFYTNKYERLYYKQITTHGQKFPEEDGDAAFPTIVKLKQDQPIETPSEQLTSYNYYFSIYYKTVFWMQKLEKEMGENDFNRMMKNYYSLWKFKHPYPNDFKAIADAGTTKNLAPVFSQLHTTGMLDSSIKKTLKPTVLFNFNNASQFNYVSLAPAIGYNHYDKIMLGGIVHNYQTPLPSFQFVAGGFYATGSKKLDGFGSAFYNIYKQKSKTAIGFTYFNYSIGDYTLPDNSRLYQRLQRFAPSVNVTLLDKNPLSTKRVRLQWKTFLLKEDQLNFKTVINGADTSDVVENLAVKTYINRLSIGVSDDRKLNPYSITFSADQGKEFLRAGVTAKYYLNYPDNKTGLDVRFFAGKFFYLVQNTLAARYTNDRYLLTLSAPKGYEDYTYSDYFIGRSEFEGWTSQQVMERDGYFKVNTELYNDKIGKTDNWLMAVNLSSGLPDKINPLSVLPFKIPLKVFADIGTYAEAWDENSSTGRFLYDAGLQLSLFGNVVNVYVPLLYSKVYSNYYKSVLTEKRFLKTISFNINIGKLRLNSIVKEVEL